MSNRRDFLTSTAAGLTTALSARRVLGANDRLTGAFIGVGTMGTENLKVALEQSLRVGAVCDVYQPHLERAAALARRQGSAPKEVKNFREILADRSIDFVCIATPDHWHPYMMVEACKAGKDVYVEKPACVAVQEVQKMVAAARKYNRVVQAGTWQRSGDHFQRACEMVRTGVLGKVTACKTWMYQNLAQAGIGRPPEGRPPAGLDWNLWLGLNSKERAPGSRRPAGGFWGRLRTVSPIPEGELLGTREQQPASGCRELKNGRTSSRTGQKTNPIGTRGVERTPFLHRFCQGFCVSVSPRLFC
jgi:Oxidoreductase family, NAD-binding Rossmann fold